MSVIKFRKKLYESYGTDKPVLVLRSQKIVSIVEVTNMRTYSCKTNKFRNVYTIGRGARSISI